MAREEPRVCVPPGADPRREWTGHVERVSSETHVAVYEYHERNGGLSAVIGIPGQVRYWTEPKRTRYVPYDVLQWRDPEHRAELTRRARELAAAVRRAGGG